MLQTEILGDSLVRMGCEDFSGVPCSFLAPLFNYALNHGRFAMANNEGDAVALASGISLAHLRSSPPRFGVVLLQNSGLCNALSPLTSLNEPFAIPILGFVSLRGERDENGRNTDEPQHNIMGAITDKLLALCEIESMFLTDEPSALQSQLAHAQGVLQSGKSFFFIVRKACLSPVALQQAPKQDSALPTRLAALARIQNLAQNRAVVLATTGKTGRELYELGDLQNQLYMVGSMGCVGTFGVGIAQKSSRKVIAIDGDGAALMRLGALAMNAQIAREADAGNFCHILLDNQSHDSTGGQQSLSPFVDFAAVALACGYAHAQLCANLEELAHELERFFAQSAGGAVFLALRIQKGSKKDLSRPKITPREVAERLFGFLER